MKKTTILIAFLILSGLCTAQEKSYSDKELFTICKTWGLLKYYHPIVSSGKADADSLLLSSLTQYRKPNEVIKNWVKYLKSNKYTVKEATINKCVDADNRNFDISWIDNDGILNKEQKTYLKNLINEKNAPGTYYTYADTASIRYSGSNEKIYKDENGNVNYRLLSLFRAWNVIEYFYPYKYSTSKKWDDVLTAFIPKFINAGTELDYTKALMEFAASIEDTHARLEPSAYAEVFGTYGAPFTFQIAESSIVVTKPVDAAACKVAGINWGDVITHVDGKTIDAIIVEKSKYLSASNNAVKIRDAYRYMFTGFKDPFTIKGYDKNKVAFNKTIQRIDRSSMVWFEAGLPDVPLISYDAKAQKIIYSQITKDNIGYIDFSLLQPKDIDSIMTGMKNTRGIIFDLRGYNDDGTLLKTFNFLLPEPKWFGISSKVDYSQPGMFCFDDFIINKDLKFIGKTNPDAYKGKVIVLINENTQSAEELWAMIFKTVPGVTFIGSQTAGADGTETPILLTDGRILIFSGLGIFYTDKSETQKVGIIPDIVVKPSINDLQNNIDPLINKAIEVIR